MTKPFLVFIFSIIYFCPPIVTAQNPVIDKINYQESITLLNDHYDFINQVIKKMGKFPRIYHDYNRSLISAQQLGRRPSLFRISPDNYNLPDALYQRLLAENTQLPKTFQKEIKNRIQEIWKVLNQTRDSYQILRKLTVQEAGKSANYDQVWEEMQKLESLNEALDLNYRQLAFTLRTVYQKHREENELNAWVRASHQMLKAVDEARTVLLSMKKHYTEFDQPVPSTEILKHLLDSLAASRKNNLEGIKEFGSYNGHDAPSAYDYVIKSLNALIENIVPKPDNTLGRNAPPFLYRNLLYDFNRAIDQYNRFAKLSFRDDLDMPPAFLLKQTNEMNIYQVKRFKQEINNSEVNIDEKKPEVMDGYAFNHLILLLDVSASMNHATRLPVLKKSLEKAADIMRPDDKLSVIVYSDRANVLMKGVPFRSEEVVTVLKKLKSSGKTRFNRGVELAYQLAQEFFLPAGNNRILLATDGEFTADDKIRKLIKSNARNGISLSVFSFGVSPTHSVMLKDMALWGKGNFTEITAENSDLKLLEELQVIIEK